MLGDFSKQADAYAKARPDYPVAMLDRIIERLEISAGDCVVDMAAGTGLLTGQLIERGLDVVAVEPNESMRKIGEKMVSGARWIHGTFEQVDLEDDSVKWMAIGQALHWANLDKALPELARVLCEGGCFTAMWNEREHGANDVVDWTHKAVHRAASGYRQKYDKQEGYLAEIIRSGLFQLSHKDVAWHVVRMDRERYLNLWRSHNHLRVEAGEENYAKFMNELEVYLEDRQVEMVDVPYVCRSWSYMVKK
ncbi:class I SAM-dependent methyltransferase [Poriferisphaera sp. WC338]|uniref:class I SAM-dependent methyltransferase n=1 Tax=Poriferisphaera sp. WC338 TaxID=3425129 RepID=UPI003D81990F